MYLDPVERVNCKDDEAYKEVYSNLCLRLDKWIKDTNDPIMNGRIPKPEGAIVNTLRRLSANENDFE